MDGANDALGSRVRMPRRRAPSAGVAPLSTLPTGRVAYRTLTDINAELQQLATTYPDKVKLFTLSKTSLLGKPIYGVEVSHNVATRPPRQAVVPAQRRAPRPRVADGRVHARVRLGPAAQRQDGR